MQFRPTGAWTSQHCGSRNSFSCVGRDGVPSGTRLSILRSDHAQLHAASERRLLSEIFSVIIGAESRLDFRQALTSVKEQGRFPIRVNGGRSDCILMKVNSPRAGMRSAGRRGLRPRGGHRLALAAAGPVDLGPAPDPEPGTGNSEPLS